MLPHIPHTPSFSLNWEEIDAAYEWVRALKDVPQDPIYHAEGDVWIHTRMVLEALVGLPAWQKLGDEAREELFWAALMHDMAKPACTEVQPDGRITSRNHSVKGERMARQYMWEAMAAFTSFAQRERIAKLVRFHGLPLVLWDKRDGEKMVLRASQHVRMDHLALLAEADVRGRICEDQAGLLERIDYFREYCQERNCYEQPFAFPSDLARFHYFYKDDAHPSYEPFDDRLLNVTMMVGVPGAGKDHWIRQNCPDLPVISLDAIRQELGVKPRDNQGRVLQLAKERAKEYLRSQTDFVWNATNIIRSRRRQLLDLAMTYKARVRIVYLEPPYATVFAQNRQREAVVSEKVIRNFISRMDLPEAWEAHEVKYEVRYEVND